MPQNAMMGEVINLADLSSSDEEEDAAADVPQIYRFYVPGQPIAMPRPKLFKNGWVNVRHNDIRKFRAALKEKIPASANGPVFPAGHPVEVTIYLMMARPKKEFVGNNRVLGRLKAAAAALIYHSCKPDIDNLAKFVLDALNGVGYHDDAQVSKLTVFQLKDNTPPFMGGTAVEFSRCVRPAAAPEDYTNWN